MARKRKRWLKASNSEAGTAKRKENLSWFKRLFAPDERTFARSGVPQLIHLSNMQLISPDAIVATELDSSLTNLDYVGTGVIVYYLNADQIRIGANVQIRDYSILEVGGSLEIGENSVIGAYNWLQSSGSITIGSGVIIGPHTVIVSTTHEPPTPDTPVRFSPLHKGKIHIGDNTWIGAHVSILKGVRIGKNVTIGAGSVVMSDIPDNATAVGAPCRVIDRTSAAR